MMIGRFLQGLGAAGPRIVSIALVRDRYEGRIMARVMSFIMTIFILVPVIAPSIGQLIIAYSDWRSIFILFLVLTIIALVWFSIRQPETLPPERRIEFSMRRLIRDIKAICSIPVAFGYTITMGLIFGAFIGYLSSSQQIFQVQYALGNQFALYFGVLAASIGLASLVNAQLVMRFGMRRLSRIAVIAIAAIGAIPTARKAISGASSFTDANGLSAECFFLYRNSVWQSERAGDGTAGSYCRSGRSGGRFNFDTGVGSARNNRCRRLRWHGITTGGRICSTSHV